MLLTVAWSGFYPCVQGDAFVMHCLCWRRLIGKRVLAGSLQPCKSFLVRCVLGAERLEPLQAAPCCHSRPGPVSALVVESQSHRPLNPRAWWGQVQHTLLPQNLLSGMRCSARNAWLPRDNPTASSCISWKSPTDNEGLWGCLQDSQPLCTLPCLLSSTCW